VSSASAPSPDFPDTLVRVEGLVKHFPVRGGFFSGPIGFVKAVDGVSFEVRRGETFGLVGESGCGKTTTGRAILRLMPVTAGRVEFEGRDIYSLNRAEIGRLRKEMQIIFQDPYSSLDPRKTVADIISEPLLVHRVGGARERLEKVQELLKVVGLSPQHARRYPHEFSGGQRQRIGVARALALNPKLIVCDEPVSALDVSIQAQVINLLEDLQEQYGLTYLFIAHELSVIKHISDRVAVMYLGKIVELAESDELYERPAHPYAEALLSAIPVPNPSRKRNRIVLQGDVPSPMNPPPGCRFHPRCRRAEARCSQAEPDLVDRGNGHFVACWR